MVKVQGNESVEVNTNIKDMQQHTLVDNKVKICIELDTLKETIN